MATNTRILQTADNALRILQFLAARQEPCSLAEIAEEMGLAKSVAHSLMFTLKQRAFVDQDSDTRRYNLGLQLITLGQAAGQRLDLRRIARPHMRDLALLTEESVYLMVPGRNMSVLLDRADPLNPIRITMGVGQESYFHAASSNKAIMAFLPDEEIERIINEVGLVTIRTGTPANREVLWEQLREIRRSGYAYTEEEQYEGIAGVAAPVFDRHHRCVASVGIGGVIQRVQPRWEILAQQIMAAAAHISRELGYTGSSGSDYREKEV